MEQAVLKTIAGFLNTNGGKLVIGVSDDGTPVGIQADGFPNEDKTSLHLVNLVKTHLGPQAMVFLHPRFEDYENERVMVIECKKSTVPVFVKDGNIERFYIRTGPSTTELSASQTQDYIRQRWS
ncbi:MAG: ATP-binding protein [Clostridia bacterium]|nr:ATP-binding protein [Clostridia bacterium]